MQTGMTLPENRVANYDKLRSGPNTERGERSTAADWHQLRRTNANAAP